MAADMHKSCVPPKMTGNKNLTSTHGFGGAAEAIKFDQEKLGSIIVTPVNAMANTALRESPKEKRHVNYYSQNGDEQITKKKIRLDGQTCGEDTPWASSKSIKSPWEKKEWTSFRQVNAVTSRISSKQDKGDEKIQEKDVISIPLKFKEKIAEEIKKQVFDGLSEAGKAGLQDLHVVDIEEMRRCTAANTNSKCSTEGVTVKKPVNPSLRQYVAKVKLMASVFIPLTVQANQELQSTEEEQEQQEQCDEFEKAVELPSKKGDEKIALLDVPDFEFYDFDRIRSENMFAEGQVWALYDDSDGMPRHYVQIRKIITIIPFNVQIAWLEPKCYSAEAHAWLASGNALTCGDYTIEESSTMGHVECFSHVIKQEVGQGRKVNIYPSEGDVWALYKGWRESDWSQRTNMGYDIVQVVPNKEEGAVTVVPLENVKGYRTVFIQKETSQKPLSISKQDLIRFSHQIPMHKLVEDKVPEVLKGCLVLDPASTPVCAVL